MQSWNVNPATGDYVMVGGAPQETDGLQVPAYFRLKVKRTKWLYAPDTKYGSDFYTIAKRPAENANQRLEDVATNALQPIVDDGRAQQAAVAVTQNFRNASELDVTITDASGEAEQVTFKGLF